MIAGVVEGRARASVGEIEIERVYDADVFFCLTRGMEREQQNLRGRGCILNAPNSWTEK